MKPKFLEENGWDRLHHDKTTVRVEPLDEVAMLAQNVKQCQGVICTQNEAMESLHAVAK